jgi:dTDP-4-amino-4,6-dideoxygalactose transaminase
MPNLNAALGMAQLEQLREFVDNKREVARNYISWCRDKNLEILIEPEGARSNYWLNALILRDSDERDSFLQETNQNDVMTRPAWNPMHHLPMYEKCHAGPLDNTDWAIDRVVNIPSSVCTCLSK